MKRIFRVSLFLYIFMRITFPVFAAESSAVKSPWEKFSLNLTYFVSDVETSVRFGSNIGVEIELEKLLGLDSTNSVFRIDSFWRFSKNRRHRFDFKWFSLHRKGDQTLLSDIVIEDDEGNIITIPAATAVSTHSNLDIFEGAYSYSFYQDDRMDLGGLAGLYIMPINTGISVSGLLNVDEKIEVTAPLPVLGLRGDFKITPKWLLRTSAQVFYLKYASYKGSMLETSASLEYLPWKHVGLGAGYNSLKLNLQSDKEEIPGIDLRGKIRFDYTGLMLYTKIYF